MPVQGRNTCESQSKVYEYRCSSGHWLWCSSRWVLIVMYWVNKQINQHIWTARESVLTNFASEIRISGKEETPDSLKAQTKTFYDDKQRKLWATGSYAFAKTIIRKQHTLNNSALIFSKLTIKIPNFLFHSCTLGRSSHTS